MRMQSGGTSRHAKGVLIGTVLAASLSCTPSLAKNAVPNLAGTWKLNEEKSESLEEKMEEIRERMGPPMMGGSMAGGSHGMGGGPRGPGGPGPGSREGGPAGPEGRTQDPVLAALVKPPLLMNVEQNESEVILSKDGHTLQSLSFKTEGDAKPTLERMRARWKGKRLEAEGTSENGHKLRETYTLSDDRKTLIIVSRVEFHREDLELKRVYDRYDGE